MNDASKMSSRDNGVSLSAKKKGVKGSKKSTIKPKVTLMKLRALVKPITYLASKLASA